jgi:hypothetical protein
MTKTLLNLKTMVSVSPRLNVDYFMIILAKGIFNGRETEAELEQQFVYKIILFQTPNKHVSLMPK